MQEVFGVKIDISNMSLEELEKIEKEISRLLFSVKFQLQMKKMLEQKESELKE